MSSGGGIGRFSRRKPQPPPDGSVPPPAAKPDAAATTGGMDSTMEVDSHSFGSMWMPFDQTGESDHFGGEASAFNCSFDPTIDPMEVDCETSAMDYPNLGETANKTTARDGNESSALTKFQNKVLPTAQENNASSSAPIKLSLGETPERGPKAMRMNLSKGETSTTSTTQLDTHRPSTDIRGTGALLTRENSTERDDPDKWTPENGGQLPPPHKASTTPTEGRGPLLPAAKSCTLTSKGSREISASEPSSVPLAKGTSGGVMACHFGYQHTMSQPESTEAAVSPNHPERRADGFCGDESLLDCARDSSRVLPVALTAPDEKVSPVVGGGHEKIIPLSSPRDQGICQTSKPSLSTRTPGKTKRLLPLPGSVPAVTPGPPSPPDASVVEEQPATSYSQEQHREPHAYEASTSLQENYKEDVSGTSTLLDGTTPAPPAVGGTSNSALPVAGGHLPPQQHDHRSMDIAQGDTLAVGYGTQNTTPTPAPKTVNFEDSHAKFVGDLRDLEDIQNCNATRLLNLQELFASSYAASLHDQSDMLDLLTLLDRTSLFADGVIEKCKGL